MWREKAQQASGETPEVWSDTGPLSSPAAVTLTYTLPDVPLPVSNQKS